MNYINYRVSLDMFDTSSQITIKAKKGDSACRIIITLTKNGKIYKIGNGCYATFNAKKSDGNFVYDNCEIENNTIVYDFTSSIDDENGVCQISAFEGVVECEVALFEGNEKLTSPRFNLVIDNTVYNGEEIFSSSESDVLRGLINEAKFTVEEIETKLENGEFKGDTGETGPQGPEGPQGPKGDKGDKGDNYNLTLADKTEIADIVLSNFVDVAVIGQ